MWEHLVIEVSGYPIPDIQQELDKVSSKGWELVSVCEGPWNYSLYLFFKRPKA